MRDALLTSLSGIRSTQTLLDVSANNLANVNTTGFRGSRVTFADQFVATWSAARAPGGGTGGINAEQSGRGVQASAIDVDTRQGGLTATGRDLDLAIVGDAFFALRAQDGSVLYTRSGAFTIDGDRAVDGSATASTLVAAGTGLRVLDRAGRPIQVVNSLAPQATDNVVLTGNLPRPAGLPLHGRTLVSVLPATTAGGVIARGDTPLADLSARTGAPMPVPLTLNLAGSLPAGATLDDLATQVSAFLAGLGSPAPARLEAGPGGLVLEAQVPGDGLSFFLGQQPLPTARDDASLESWQHGAPGDALDWSRLRLVSGPVVGQTQVVTADGERRTITTAAYASGAGADGSVTWTVFAADPPDGVLLPGANRITGLTVAPDGSLRSAGAGSFAVAWADGATTTAQVAAGDLTGYPSGGRALVGTGDGYVAGSLERVGVDADGTVRGWYSNGITAGMGQDEDARVQLARFANPAGLLAVDGTAWRTTGNSGAPQVVGDTSSTIRGGMLEAANIGISEEFTRLILAQRGFQTNARAFQVADGMSQEANSLIR
jgi:flagellar hook protein FlgE